METGKCLEASKTGLFLSLRPTVKSDSGDRNYSVSPVRPLSNKTYHK